MNEEFEREEKFGRTPFDYKTILLIHLRNMSSLVTAKVIPSVHGELDPRFIIHAMTQITDKNLVTSVNFLESLLAPYIDKEYEEDMRELGKKHKGKTIEQTGRKFTTDKLAVLVKLMDRLNLLLEKESKEKI